MLRGIRKALIQFSLLLIVLGCLSSSLPTDTKFFLPAIISDRMILQQQEVAAIWGWDKPGTLVTVTFRGNTVSTIAQPDGKWLARIPTGTAGQSFSLKIAGTQTVTLTEIAVGEVWVAGGQSNMWWPVKDCKDGDREIQGNPEIRLWDANTESQGGGWQADTPQKTVATEWRVATPETIRNFPGTAYFFARELHQRLQVPVGIIHLAVPGQPIETFLSPTVLEAHFPEILELWEARKKLYSETWQQYQIDLQSWNIQHAIAQSQGRESPQKPEPPIDPQTVVRPGAFFNGMIHPVVPYGIKGFLWWQGEANAERPLQYRILFPTLIEEWRELWHSPASPFLFVELANFLPKQTQPVEDKPWSALRDAQTEALRLSQTFRISTIDILDESEDVFNIHPFNKKLAGHRLFLAAMANVYGDRALVASGPVYQSVKFQGDRARITFENVGSGLVAKGGGELTGFALAGRDRKFFWAKARIKNDRVILTSPSVKEPIAVRYAWANNPIGNLYNKEGLPAFPFRTDRWILRGKRRARG